MQNRPAPEQVPACFLIMFWLFLSPVKFGQGNLGASRYRVSSNGWSSGWRKLFVPWLLISSLVMHRNAKAGR